MTEKRLIYAPVVIPTLCRAETFIPCIESLTKCVGAEYTDVYIALDFPSKDAHWDGYKQIEKFLDNTKFPFKTFSVIKRTKNFGVYGPNSNFNRICNELWKIYDRLIFSEDDNVFSPNFLLFVNNGLELFKNDSSVDSICGYLHYNGVKTSGNTFYRCPHIFSAWGYATWRDRKEKWDNITTKYYREKLSLKNILSMCKLGRFRFLAYLTAMCPTDYLWINDVNLSTYMILENKCQIIPTISLVRNIGVRSGEHFSTTSEEIVNIYMKQPVSCESTFDFIGTGYEFQKENIHDWINKDKLFYKKFNWLTWNEVIKLTIRKIIKIILGEFGWKR